MLFKFLVVSGVFCAGLTGDDYVLQTFTATEFTASLCGSAECKEAYQSAYVEGSLSLKISRICDFNDQYDWRDAVLGEFFDSDISPPDCYPMTDATEQLSRGIWKIRASFCP